MTVFSRRRVPLHREVFAVLRGAAAFLSSGKNISSKVIKTMRTKSILIRKIVACAFLASVLAISGWSLDYQAQSQLPAGSWTGGFWLNGNWVAVLVQFNPGTGDTSSTASVIFPAFGSQNAINVPLSNLEQTSSRWHFDIPVPGQKVISFDGIENDETITGKFAYGESNGT